MKSTIFDLSSGTYERKKSSRRDHMISTANYKKPKTTRMIRRSRIAEYQIDLMKVSMFKMHSQHRKKAHGNE